MPVAADATAVAVSGRGAALRSATPPRLATIEVARTVEAALPAFSELATAGVGPVYQDGFWVSAWLRHIGQPAGVEPVFVVGRTGSEVAFVWPLGLRHRYGLGIAGWLGGAHSNYNFGLYRPGFAERATAAEVNGWLDAIVARVPGIDLFALACQPALWQGAANPLALLPKLPSDCVSYSVPLDGGFEALLARNNGARKKKKLRWQTNTLAPLGGYRVVRGTDAETARSILDAFATQKAAQFARRGLPNAFARPGVMDFFRDIADPGTTEAPLIETWALEIGGTIRATFAGGGRGGRFSGYFNSIAEDDLARVSPGELLLHHVISDCCDRGYATFDLGVGDARYKASWCDTEDEMFGTLVPVTARGRAALPILSAARSARRTIRANPTAFALVQRLRRLAGG